MVCPAGFSISKIRYHITKYDHHWGPQNTCPIGHIQYAHEEEQIFYYRTIQLDEDAYDNMIAFEINDLGKEENDKRVSHADTADQGNDICGVKINKQDSNIAMMLKVVSNNTIWEDNKIDKSNNSGNNTKYKVWAGAKHKLGPCPTLRYCLGHQACLFQYGKKFCQNDPIPSHHTQIDIQLYCTRDGGFETFVEGFTNFQNFKPKGQSVFENIDSDIVETITEKVRSYPKKTAFIKYKDIIDGSISPLKHPIKVTIGEEEVFEVRCPLPKDIHNAG